MRQSAFVHGLTAGLEIGLGQAVRLSLEPGGLAILLDVRDQRLVCEAGELWVTLDRDSADYVLGTGQSLLIASNAKVIVTARSASAVRVAAASAAGSRDRHAGVAPERLPAGRLGHGAVRGIA